ncbi:DUF2933 domain-containing protein [Bacillus mycoides]|nr:DUF2933 domain-containing protein [Bacillus mycoides]
MKNEGNEITFVFLLFCPFTHLFYAHARCRVTF